MLVSRIWVVLLTAAAVAGLGLARLVPNPAAREIAKAYADNLDRGQHNADLILRLEARDWIDAVAKMAWDGSVIDLLEQASNRRGEIKSHQAKLSGRLLALVGLTRAEARPQLIIALDHRGKQITRIGPGEESYAPGEDGLAGYPLVDAALRGYRTDDTWSIDGKLLLMAASPVISRSRGRYVGALLVGLDINDAFARRLKSRLAGTDLAFFVRGKLVATTVRVDGLERLSEQFDKRTAEIKKHGRSAVVRLGAGSSSHTAILASLPGEAAEHSAFYAAVGSPVPAVGLGEMLGMISAADLRWTEFPWLLVLGLLVIAAAIGLALVRWEYDMPLRRLLASADRLGRGEVSRLDEYAGGGMGRLAHAVNEAHDKLVRRGPSTTKESSRQPVTPEPAAPLDLGAALASSGNLLETEDAAQPLGGIAALEAISPPMALLDPSSNDFAGERRQDLPSHRERAVFSLSTSSDPAPAAPSVGAAPIEIPALNLNVTTSKPTAAALQAVPSSTGMVASSFDLEPGLAPPPQRVTTTTATGLRAIKLPESEEAALAAKPPPMPIAAPEPRLPLPPRISSVSDQFAVPDPTPVVSVDAEDEYYRQVFKDFLAVKQQCGESTSSLTYERFVEKLRKNRDTLIKSYGCKSVRFQVYIKDGKAALKATPVKD